VRRDGALVQVDRGGHPTINPFINPEYAKDEYNARHPVDDVAKYLEPWSQILRQNGYPAAEAAAAPPPFSRTSCGTTAAGRPPIPTGARSPMTSSAPVRPS
jgi:hypothetical protein